MNLIVKMLINFFKEEKINTIIIVITSILVNIIQTQGISTITANIINTVEKGKVQDIYGLLHQFVFMSMIFIFLLYIYTIFQNKLTTKLLQWIRLELASLVLKHNNEDFTDKNFIKLNAPVNRISSVCFMFVTDLFSFLLPMFAFFVVICAYFIYHDSKMGLLFLFANLIIIAYVYLALPSILKKNEDYEKQFTENESYFLEILNNMDKIVFMGKTKHEIEEYKNRIEETINKALFFYSHMNNHSLMVNIYIYIIIFAFMYYHTRKIVDHKIDIVLYITFITIILLYRDRMSTVIQQLVEFVEFSGRANGVLNHFKDIEYGKEPKYSHKELKFDKVTFKDVSFKYRTKNIYALKHFNMELYLNNKIIGITGRSGRGKSTFMKLFLKMYKNYEGEIFIDDVNIKEVEPDYIRKKVVYVSQNFKLFDRVIVENMLYGCNQNENCKNHLQQILQNFPKIKELFKDNDIYTTNVGSLGEKMSGGQKVVISIICGLVTPSVGLILDEPTNGLDGQLKNEVLQLIQAYRKYKKFIIIITHDKDVYKILDERKDL